LITAVVAVLVPTTEALAEIIVVLILVKVIARITVVCVLIRITVLVVRTPAILPVCLPGAEAFLIAVVYGPPE